jgi:hypothetical protein
MKYFQFGHRQGFGKTIGNLIIRRDEPYVQFLAGHMLTHKVKIHLSVLGPAMKPRVSRHVCGTQIVTP